jgi:branched-chain amino acid transport system permease protein
MHPMVRDALLTALLATALAAPLIGVQMIDVNGGVTFVTHPYLVVYSAAAVFLGRLALGLTRDRWRARKAPPSPKRKAYGAMPIGVIGIVAAAALPLTNSYYIDIGTTVLIYVMLGWGLNLVVGVAGLLDLGYVAFYAVGAYTVGLLSTWLGLSFWMCLPLAGLFAAAFGVLLGLPILRLRGDYLAIVTLGFGEIVRIVLLNWANVTGGPNGIGNLPRPSFFGLPFARTASSGPETFAGFFSIHYAPSQRVIFQYYVILILALAANALVGWLRRRPIGRAWEALREDEIAVRAMGINPTRVKLAAFGLGAMLAGFAGAFFAARQGFISPESFIFSESATILAIVVLGGMGSQAGIVLAALVLVVLPEIGRSLAEYRMLLFGAGMIGIMVWRPGGLVPVRRPSILLRQVTARLGFQLAQ